MQVKDQINQWRDTRKPKRGGSGQIFELLYFQNRKEFATDFFCVFILPIDEHIVWIWAKSEGVTWHPVVHLAWNDPYWTGVKFSSLSDFNESGLKLIRLPCWFRKCLVSCTVSVPILVKRGGQSSTSTDHIWALTFDPLIHILTFWLPRYAKLYFFWIILVIQSIWAHFRWNRTNLKIWPLYKRSLTFC